MLEIGLSIGADGPFCIKGGCAVAGGIGEKLLPLPVLELDLLIVKGKRGVSTAKLFRSLNLNDTTKAVIDTHNAIDAIICGNKIQLAKSMGNALQPTATEYAPEIEQYCKQLLSLGAMGACMTGSGSAVVGVFANRQEALSAEARLLQCDFSAVCRSISE